MLLGFYFANYLKNIKKGNVISALLFVFLAIEKENFLKNSCRKWVAYEIIAYIKKYPWENPVKSLKRFSDKMLKYSKISKTDMSKYFLIAHDMAEEILRIFEDIWGLKG